MTRQIKFRGRRTDNGEWVYGNYAKLSESEHYILNRKEDWFDTIRVDPSTVGQFTGLTDCEGKDIFEGDILSWPGDEDFLPETVIFKDGCFMAKDEYTCVAISEIDMKYRKVIGTIHKRKEESE